MTHRPKWFKDGVVLMSNAPTCGINKDGAELYKVDADGKRLAQIDDRLADDVSLFLSGKTGGTTFSVPTKAIAEARIATPTFFDLSTVDVLKNFVAARLKGFELRSVRDLVNSGDLKREEGHGSPSADRRVGAIPYIKVSDLRAGSVNINPTNMVPRQVAEEYWGGSSSGLKEFDLISPARTSKNIGDFCVLMPGQEEVVLTKEVFIFRVASKLLVDQFYLLWALTLEPVRAQWKRLVLMQTNREDVGDRVDELLIPVPPNSKVGSAHSAPFREYYGLMLKARKQLADGIAESGLPHRITIGTVEPDESASDDADAADA